MIDLQHVLTVALQLAVVAELGLCFGMTVAWMRRLPFRYELEIALEPGTRETATQGMTSNASWRYLPGPRMLA
jgi:hypothetical protein